MKAPTERSMILCCVLLGLALLSACAPLKPPPGKGILWVDPAAPWHIGRGLGLSSRYASVSRDSTGDQVFVSFTETETNGMHKLVLVSADAIRVKDLPTSGFLDDSGLPFLWWNSSRGTDVVNKSLLPTDVGIEGGHNVTDGKFVALFHRSTGEAWIASIESPLTELLMLPPGARLSLFLAHRDRLHIFLVRDMYMFQYLEYEVHGNTAHLLRTRDFKWVGDIYDFDPESGTMLVASDAFMFQHAYLANVNTGARRRLGLAGATGYFVKDAVIRQYRAVLEKAQKISAGSGKS